MLIMAKPVHKVGDKVALVDVVQTPKGPRAVQGRVGVVTGHSRVMRDRKTERALVLVKMHKGKYPSQAYKDEHLIPAE